MYLYLFSCDGVARQHPEPPTDEDLQFAADTADLQIFGIVGGKFVEIYWEDGQRKFEDVKEAHRDAGYTVTDGPAQNPPT